MAFCTVQWSSATIRKQVQANVILPDSGKGPFPVLYLLHGLSDDYSIWHRRTRIESYVAGKPLIVVMPDGYRSFYTNHEQGPAYFDYMTQDLPQFIERNFPAKSSRMGRCVGGLSMGGYGALRIALGRPDLYASATSHSGALLRGTQGTGNPQVFNRDEMRRIFGARPRGSDHDLIALAKRAKRSKVVPKIRIDCGTEDFLLEENRTLHKELGRMGIDHEYQEFPGTHGWDYWDQHVREAIAFHAKVLKF